MNTTTRRIAPTLVGVGLAASAVATAGPAVAAKPGGGGTTVQPLNIYGDNVYPVDGTPYMSISYQVPSRAQKVTCSLDGSPSARAQTTAPGTTSRTVATPPSTRTSRR